MRLIKKLLVLSTLSAALAATSAGVIAADAKPTIKIGYVEGWDDSVATSNVAAQIIEKKLGYPVQLVPVAAGVMWQGVARGDLDMTLCAWLPVTHGTNTLPNSSASVVMHHSRTSSSSMRAGIVSISFVWVNSSWMSPLIMSPPRTNTMPA